MTGSMYAAVSGLKAHMSALNVIGNNVSNVNTLGYKATRYTFNEALYTTQRTGSDGTNVVGGTNPAQVGFGSSIGTIDLDMSTKNYSPTGNQLDTMIDGDGFFFVGDKELGSGATAVEVGDTTALGGMNLTRLGNFSIDPNGYLVDGNGSVVWGYLEQEVDSTNMRFDLVHFKAVEPTVAEDGTVTPATAPTGTAADKFKKLTDLTEDEVNALVKHGVNLHNVKYKTVVEKQTIDGNEVDVKVSKVSSATMTVTNAMSSIRMPMKDTEANKVEWPKYTEAKEVEYNTAGDPNSGVKNAAEPAHMKDYESSKAERLQADSVTIDEKSGALRAMTSDGTLYTIGYIAIAKVTNPNGVTHVDGRYYQAQGGAGVIRATAINGALGDDVESAGDTSLLTGGLESSGTDLATEITNMITIQRGYQANTRIVTVTDSMLEELVNMKR